MGRGLLLLGSDGRKDRPLRRTLDSNAHYQTPLHSLALEISIPNFQSTLL